MKNTFWKYDKFGKNYGFYRKDPEKYIVEIYNAGGGYWELPAAWFGRNKDYSLKKKKTLASAKKAVEKWFSDFIKSVS